LRLDGPDADALQVDPSDRPAHRQPVVAVRAAVDWLEPRLQPVQVGAYAVVLLDEEVPVAPPQPPRVALVEDRARVGNSRTEVGQRAWKRPQPAVELPQRVRDGRARHRDIAVLFV